MLEKALEALKTYDWGQDAKVLAPIDQAILDAKGDAAKRLEVEKSLAEVLKAKGTFDGRQAVCRYLMQIGTAASVPALADLLGDKELGHMARYALERIPAPEAGKALQDALAKVSGSLKAGVITSLASRGASDAVAAIAALTGDADAAVSGAAIAALGALRTPEAAKAVASVKQTPANITAVADASFACAESLTKAGKKDEAAALYKSFAGADVPKHIKLAATRGLLGGATK